MRAGNKPVGLQVKVTNVAVWSGQLSVFVVLATFHEKRAVNAADLLEMCQICPMTPTNKINKWPARSDDLGLKEHVSTTNATVQLVLALIHVRIAIRIAAHMTIVACSRR